MQNQQDNPDVENAVRPSLLRILLSIFYDLWLILAIWMLGVTLDTVIRQALTGSSYLGNHLLLQLYLLVSPMFFYAWFWTHGGQTLGMRAWRIKALAMDGQPVSWRQAIIRCLGAILSLSVFGLGYLWILVNKNNASWHDLLSNTCLVMVKKHTK